MRRKQANRRSGWAEKRRASQAVADARVRLPRMLCPFCQREKLYLLPGGVGLIRCEGCGYQGTDCAIVDGVEVVTFAGEHEPPRIVRRDATGHTIRMPYGDVTVRGDADGNITADHERGRLRITKDGRLVGADGVFADAFVLADRPPPCPGCGSPHTAWLAGEDSREAVAARATALGRSVEAIPCEGRTLDVIEGYGGRTARCRPCGRIVVYPTDPAFGSDGST